MPDQKPLAPIQTAKPIVSRPASWANLAPLAPGDRGIIPSSSTLTNRLDSMKRKPVPNIRTPRPR